LPSAPAAKEGPNDKFLRPDLDVPEWVKKFESPGREVYDKRREIVAATKVRKGSAVADVGAGTGLFTMEFAQAVGPTGKVYAVDIAPKFLQHIARRGGGRGHKNVTTVRGSARSVELPAAAVDLVFVCDTYHHFDDPKSTLASNPAGACGRAASSWWWTSSASPARRRSGSASTCAPVQDVVTREIEADGLPEGGGGAAPQGQLRAPLPARSREGSAAR
jgi:SAM-dependent methyltransferase